MPALLAVKQAGVRLFTFTGIDAQGSEMAQSMVTALPAIRRFLVKHEPPFIAKISRSGTVSMWVSREELHRPGGY